MLRNTILISVAMFFLFGAANSQDIHYSQFFNSPLNLNPALTGQFNGNMRIHGNYRRQWTSVPVDYLSADVGIDFKLYKPGKQNFLGLGALINYDKAGDLNLGMTGLNAFASYSIEISKNKSITPGINLSFAQRRYDADNALSGNQWNGLAFDPLIAPEFVGADSRSYFDLGVGLNYRGQKTYRKHLDLGVGLYHIIQPTDKFNTTSAVVAKRPMRLTVYGMLNQPLAEKLDLLVNGLFHKQDVYQEIVANLQGKLYFGDNLDKALYLGLGYRFDDAWYPMIALEIGRIYASFSYDRTISDWQVANNGNGGPELSIRYIIANLNKGPFKPCLIY